MCFVGWSKKRAESIQGDESIQGEYTKRAQEKREMDFHELEEIRLDAYESLRIYKERTKAFHDKRIVPKVFKAGDDVLLYNSRLKLFPGKLKSRWSGPFKVKEVLPYGDITLVNQNGVEFMVTVTG
ncbi:unnamed protein product [Microthlaspi erraticum]|uniref:Reverse transcriptase domain-containing protein n=1 Tax=Microthlaspi erraticum TaxID=1685480 RepID=A0A6D2I1T5_9BRAS|nr:unnamed protein product [Microthlaspi erraticum]